MLKIIKTNSENQDFINLVKLLDADLKITDGDDHDFYNQYNQLDNIKYVLVAYLEGEAVACGAIKYFDEQSMEVKRMYVKDDFRGQRISVELLKQLEKWAKELGFERCVLETGIKQIPAIGLYKKCNYQIIENYGQYIGVENSVCFAKLLSE